MYKYKFVKISVLIVLLVLPVVLFFLPMDFFDQGTSICPSKRWLDIECLGCGLTRAVMHFIHFDFQGAWAFNKLSFIVVPAAGLYWVYQVRKIAQDLQTQNS
jgi:hypothetical protein